MRLNRKHIDLYTYEAEPLFGTNRNITEDNWFSSIELVDELKNHGLTYVGTMREKQKRHSLRVSANERKNLLIHLYLDLSVIEHWSHMCRKKN